MPGKRHNKPVRKCYSCLLNLGTHCWTFPSPRAQWLGGAVCPGFENEGLYANFREEQKRPSLMTRRALRREALRTRKRLLPS